MKLLAEKPYQSGCLLIKELRNIPETAIYSNDEEKHKSSMHIIWCIRALRYLTGLDFKGTTKHIFTKQERDRKYWLTLKNEQELPFFADWMSRENIYIAPKDAQEEIIKKWKSWFLENGEKFNYKTDTDLTALVLLILINQFNCRSLRFGRDGK